MSAVQTPTIAGVRIAYCTNVRLPSERAHGHQVARVCDALVRLGHEVTIFSPFRRNVVREDYWTYHGADRGVKLTHVGSFDPIDRRYLPGIASLWMLNALLRRGLKRVLGGAGFDLLYTRTPALLSALLCTEIPVVLELHSLPRLRRRAFVSRCKRCKLVVCLTSSMRDTLHKWGVPSARLMTEGDAVDLRKFLTPVSREEARKTYHLPSGKFVVGYVGRLKTLGMEKGVGILLEALKHMRRGTFFGFIVGGPAEDVHHYKDRSLRLGLIDRDVRLAGEIPASDIPAALAACDVLVMPFPDVPHYRHHMSPLKMFEYMASGRPIITSDLPTVRDVLSEKTAFFCVPGDAQSLAQEIEYVHGHRQEAEERAAAARSLVERHTWEERMRRIVDAATLRTCARS